MNTFGSDNQSYKSDIHTHARMSHKRRNGLLRTGLVILIVSALLAAGGWFGLRLMVRQSAATRIDRAAASLKGSVVHDEIRIVDFDTLAAASIEFADADGIRVRAEGVTIDVDPVAMLIGGRKITSVKVDRLVVDAGSEKRPWDPGSLLNRLRPARDAGSVQGAEREPAATRDVPSSRRQFLMPDVTVNSIEGSVFSNMFSGQIERGTASLSGDPSSIDAGFRAINAAFDVRQAHSSGSFCVRVDGRMSGTGGLDSIKASVSPPFEKKVDGAIVSIGGAGWRKGEASLTGISAEIPGSAPFSGRIDAEEILVRWSRPSPENRSLAASIPESLLARIPARFRPMSDLVAVSEVRVVKPVLNLVEKAGGQNAGQSAATVEPQPPHRRISGRYSELLDLIESARRSLTETAGLFPDVRFGMSGATVRYVAAADGPLSAGHSLANADLQIEKLNDGELSVRLRFECPESPSVANEVNLSVSGDGTVSAGLKASRLMLEPYRSVMPSWLGTGSDTAVTGTDFVVKITQGPVVEASGRVALSKADISVPELASATMTGVDFGFSGKVTVDGRAARLLVNDAVFSLGALEMPFSFTGDNMAQAPRIRLDARLERARAADMLASIPAEAIPVLKGTRIDGTFAASMTLAVNTADVSTLDFDFTPDVTDLITLSLGDAVNLELLRSTFLHRIEEDDKVVTRMIGPESPGWVPLEGVPSYLVSALTASEDSRFFTHHGFSRAGIERSLKVNLSKGGFIQGASTLSQQLVKNLFLSREKTLARKLQEAFITWQIEKNLPKEKILELYLNVIEWGPDVWGLKEAANHYFGKDPSNLTVLETAWLVSIIPNPVRYHKFFEEGRVPQPFMSRIQKLVQSLRVSGAISDLEAAAAAEQTVRFVPAGPVPEGVRDDLPDAADDDVPDDEFSE